MELKEFKRVRRWCQAWTIILLLILFLIGYFFVNIFPVKYNNILVQNQNLLIGFIGVCIVVVCLYVVLTYFCVIKPRKKYIKYYKELFVLKTLKQYFTGVVYKSNAGVSKKTIADTRVIRMGDRFSSNDYVSGKYKGVKFRQSDVHIEKERHIYIPGEDEISEITYYTTLFKGRWMVFDFNKNFKSNVCVYEEGFLNKGINSIFSSVEYKKVNLESDKFNSEFNVYAINEEEAFYIITPHLMEKISRLNDKCSGKLLLCFIDNKLHVGIDNDHDSFEAPSYFKIFSKKTIIKSITKDIMLITMFVDELGLDNELFKSKDVN